MPATFPWPLTPPAFLISGWPLLVLELGGQESGMALPVPGGFPGTCGTWEHAEGLFRTDISQAPKRLVSILRGKQPRNPSNR